MGQYDKALEEYGSALKVQEMLLPEDHPGTIRTLNNLAAVHAHREDLVRAKEYLVRAEETASRTFSTNHPIMSLIKTTKDLIDEKDGKHIDSQQ